MLKLALSSLSSLFIALAGILGIGLLITLHEFGHFIFCKVFGVKTPSFSIGLGPRLLSKKIGDTVFTLSAIPMGGYVEIAGSAEVGQGDQKEAFVNDASSFSSKPYWQKIIIMLGGIGFNLLFAYLVFVGLFCAGLPKTNLLTPFTTQPVIAAFAEETSPARDAGLAVGDRIVSLQGEALNNNMLTLLKTISTRPNETIILGIERAGNYLEIPVTIGAQTVNAKTFGLLGVQFVQDEPNTLSTWQSFLKGITLTNTWIKETVNAYLNLLRGRNLNEVAGPLSIFSESIKGAGQGLKIFLVLLAIISINLAILNLIPLPIFDGGQATIVTLEAILRRTIPYAIKEGIFMVSWVLIIALLIFTSVKDVARMVDWTAIKTFLHL